MSSVYEIRLNKLRTLFKSDKEAALVTNEINIGYFCGFHHSEGVMVVTLTDCYLLVDFRYIEAAEKYAKCCKVICFKKLSDELIKIFVDNNISGVYAEASDLSVQRYNFYEKVFKKSSVEIDSSSVLDNCVSKIRIVKDKTEFEKILKAQQIAEAAYKEILNYIKPGVTERSIAVEFEYLMKKKGAERVAFDLITITGKKTSLPHGVPSDDIINNGDFFTMDFGAVYDGYHSDTTRTVAVGAASNEMQRIYSIVLEAQLAALKKIKAGIKCSEVDNTARNIISAQGFGDYFGHATGHGVGLEIHENPVVSFRSDTVLSEGMVITDEPGIYLPDKFGVRIEDMVYVTDEDCKNFVTLPKELIIL